MVPAAHRTAQSDMQDVRLIIRFTRYWIHYGFMALVAICALIGAGEGLLGR